MQDGAGLRWRRGPERARAWRPWLLLVLLVLPLRAGGHAGHLRGGHGAATAGLPGARRTRRLQLRGGGTGYAAEIIAAARALPPEDERFKWMDDVVDVDPAWHRPARIGHSHVVESIRVIPADAGQVLGGSPHVPDHSVREWHWADAAGAGARRAAAGAPVLSVPDQVPSVHRAVGACQSGGIVSVRSGLFRWDGVIKVRKGRLPASSGAAGADAAAASGAEHAVEHPGLALPNDSAAAHGGRPRDHCGAAPDGAAQEAGGADGGGGIHVRGVEGTVLLGQWLFGRGSAGSLSHVGLAGNLTLVYEVLPKPYAQNPNCETRNPKLDPRL